MSFYRWIGVFVLVAGVSFSCKSSRPGGGQVASLPADDGIEGRLDHTAVVSNTPEVEAVTTGTLIAGIKQSIQGFRDAHPKAHGCFDDVELKVNDDIPDFLRNAVFTPGLSYKAAIRSSHGSSNPKANDLINDLHGFALKIFLDDRFPSLPPIQGNLPVVDPATGQVNGVVAVDELQLSADQGVGMKYYQTLDIITINGIHEFMVNRLSDYKDFFAAAGVLKEVIPHILANQGAIPTELSNPALNPALAPVKLAIERGPVYQQFKAGRLSPQQMGALVVELKNAVFAVTYNRSRGGEDGAVAALIHQANQQRTWDVSQSRYQSFVPYRYGGDPEAAAGPAVKYQIAGVDCSTGQEIMTDNGAPPAHVAPYLGQEGAENFLGKVLRDQVASRTLCFSLRAQPWRDGYPSLDDAAAVWGDRKYHEIATFSIPQGAAFMDSGKCEKLSFNPGHGPKEFQGAGEIQRARRLIYAAIETLRNEQRQAE